MSIIQKTQKEQGFLFSEPLFAETGVWCELSVEIDPAEWAGLCRKIGRMGAQEFAGIKGVIDSYLEGRMAQDEHGEVCIEMDKAPLVSIGPSGMRGEYQREIRREAIKTEMVCVWDGQSLVKCLNVGRMG